MNKLVLILVVIFPYFVYSQCDRGEQLDDGYYCYDNSFSKYFFRDIFLKEPLGKNSFRVKLLFSKTNEKTFENGTYPSMHPSEYFLFKVRLSEMETKGEDILDTIFMAKSFRKIFPNEKDSLIRRIEFTVNNFFVANSSHRKVTYYFMIQNKQFLLKLKCRRKYRELKELLEKDDIAKIYLQNFLDQIYIHNSSTNTSYGFD